jgi:DNA-binding NtrC family response regulator
LQRALSEVDPQLTAAVSAVELCAQRRWPGNVRELLVEARHAGHTALAQGAQVVRAEHFGPLAGASLSEVAEAEASQPPSAASESARSASGLDDNAILAALSDNGGNVSRAAQALGLHRNQLRRWLAKRGAETPE